MCAVQLTTTKHYYTAIKLNHSHVCYVNVTINKCSFNLLCLLTVLQECRLLDRNIKKRLTQVLLLNLQT